MTKIYQEKNNSKSYIMFAKLNSLILLISISIIIIFIFLADWIINLLYGAKYLAVSSILPIMAIASTLSSLGTASTGLIIREGGYNYISKKMFFTALFSIPISYFFIKYFGLIGASYSIVVIELLSLTLFNYFYKNGIIFKVHFWFLYRKKQKTT